MLKIAMLIMILGGCVDEKPSVPKNLPPPNHMPCGLGCGGPDGGAGMDAPDANGTNPSDGG